MSKRSPSGKWLVFRLADTTLNQGDTRYQGDGRLVAERLFDRVAQELRLALEPDPLVRWVRRR